MLPRQYIEINGLRIAYSEHGKGEPVLLVHGFAESSFTWEKLVGKLPPNHRHIMPDLKGFGYSDKTLDGDFSPLSQSKIIIALAAKLELQNITLVGHSFGGAVCLLALLSHHFRRRIDKLILIDSAGHPATPPKFIRQLRSPLTNNFVFNYVNSEILSRVTLEEVYHDKNKIDREYVREYASLLRLPGAVDCLIESAKKITGEKPNRLNTILSRLNIPTLIVWGAEDSIIPVANARLFLNNLPDAKLAVIPDCGNSPQEEAPDETAALITSFLTGGEIPTVIAPPRNDGVTATKKILRRHIPAIPAELKLRKLFDSWTPGVFILFVFMKILQILKKLGLRASESGWRKTMSAYLRTEHSKFALAVFGLDILSDLGRIKKLTREETENHIVVRLAEFLKTTPSSHWKVRWGRFGVFREPHFFMDIIKAEFKANGELVSIAPHFDTDKPSFHKLDNDTRRAAGDAIIENYNLVKNMRDERRPRILRGNLRRWERRQTTLSADAKRELTAFVNRVLSGNFISFQSHAREGAYERFSLPDFINAKHAGLGLLNIACRLNAEMDEADFWFQFQHVPVDGVPMQEFLLSLKKAWGIRRHLVYPALDDNPEPVPQPCSTDKRWYQAHEFVDFRPFLAMRKKLNAKHGDAMGGPATVVSMIMWALAQHESLKGRKFIFPVELAACESSGLERAPSAIFIRPAKFTNRKDPLRGFLDFQYQFNLKMHATRARKSESYEVLELFALTFPLLYTLTRKIMPYAVGEMTGTVGITMIKDADLFITPMSDLQSEGFFAVGNLAIPTEDGKKAGCVSVRAPKEMVPKYIEAIRGIDQNIAAVVNGRSEE